MSEQTDPLTAAAAAMDAVPVEQPTGPAEGETPPAAPPVADGETPTAETAGDEPKESMTALYAKLAARDKELRQYKKAAKTGGLDELKELAGRDLGEALKQLGIDDTHILDHWSAKMVDEQPPPAEEQPWRSEMEKVRAELGDALKKIQASEDAKVEERAVATFGIKAQQDTARWEAINKGVDEGALTLAYQVAQEMYNEMGGEMPDFAEALDATEEKILEVHRARLKQAAAVDKLKDEAKQIFGLVETPEPPKSNGAQQSKTLSTGGSDTQVPREMDDDDRFKAALAAMDAGG